MGGPPAGSGAPVGFGDGWSPRGIRRSGRLWRRERLRARPLAVGTSPRAVVLGAGREPGGVILRAAPPSRLQILELQGIAGDCGIGVGARRLGGGDRVSPDSVDRRPP